jgi:F-type H+-transporting ATPase subunit a
VSERTRNILIVLGVVAIMIASRFILALPELPEISLAPEVLVRIGGVFPFTNSLLLTIIVDLLLITLSVVGMRRKALVPRGLQNVLEVVVDMMYNLGVSIDRRNIRRFFPIVATIFLFVFFSNFLALLPGVGSIGVCRTHEAAAVNPAQEETVPEEPVVEEGAQPEQQASANPCGTDAEGHELVLVPLLRSPSADLNMPLALALIVFVATQYFGFQALGLNYLNKFFTFSGGIMAFFVGILEFISEFVRIIAFTFRLFGNIFAGEVVLLVMAFLAPWLLPLPFYGFEVFVAFIQAFIFAVLALVFMSLATHAHEEAGHPPIPADSRELATEAGE